MAPTVNDTRRLRCYHPQLFDDRETPEDEEKNASEYRQDDSHTQAEQGSSAGAGHSVDQWSRATAARAPAHAAADDPEVTAAEAEGAALEALIMTTIMWLVDIAIFVLCFGVGSGLVVSLWRSCRGKPVVRTEEEEIARNAALDALLNDIVRSSTSKSRKAGLSHQKLDDLFLIR